MKPIFLGISAALFFTFTFVLNRSMSLSGGSWIWSASLRYIFTIPFLMLIVISRRNLRPLLQEMRKHPGAWILWSFVGFGLFYSLICFASAYSPSWLIAGTWQMTIISGSLLAPIFFEIVQTPNGPQKRRGKIPLKGLAVSMIILAGIGLMQFAQIKHSSIKEIALGTLPVILASFAYPLGNRKMMELSSGRLDTYQRVLGMTLASLPLWIVLFLYGRMTIGVPDISQIIQSVVVAIFSGVIATVLFFHAAELVRGSMQRLAAVEATQSLEVVFAAVGEILFITPSVPSVLSWIGMFIIVAGMIVHSYISLLGTTNRPIKKKKTSLSI